MRLENPTSNAAQRPFYNGWKSDHFVINLLLFGPDGKIRAAMLNCPGCMHDSELAGFGDPSICKKIDDMCDKHGAKCVMDSAFCTRNRESIIKSVPRDQIFASAENAHEALIRDAALSVRQSAEWGMRALQGSMPRLKSRWKFEENDERLVSLAMIALLHNYRTDNLPANQIRNVFMPNDAA